MRRPHGERAPVRAAGILLGLVLSLALPDLAAAADEGIGTATIAGPAEVVDGDRLKIGPVAIRLHGIDAPEAGQDCPEASGAPGPAESGRRLSSRR